MKGRLFLIFGLLLGLPALSQPILQTNGQVVFQTAPCRTLCNQIFWEQTDEAKTLEIIDALNSPDALDENGRTALYYAVLYGTIAQVEALLAKGADPNGRSPEQEMPSPLISYLTYRAEDYQIDDGHEIAVPLRVKNLRSPDMVRLLIEAGAGIDLPTDSANPPFLSAIRLGEEAITSQFVMNEDYPELVRKYEFELLSTALISKNQPLVDQLLANGASLDAVNSDTGEGLLIGMMPGPQSVLLLGLIAEETGDDYTDLLSLVSFALANGVDPNIPDNSGVTPLMTALHREIAGLVDLLLEAGADPNAVDDLGNTPLFYLATNPSNSEELLDTLIAAGGDPLHRNKNGKTLLHVGAAAAAPQVFERLAVEYALINSRDNNGQTPLFGLVTGTLNSHSKRLYPLFVKDVARLQAFIDLGADINETDDSGATALYRIVAAEPRYGLPALAQILTDVGAISIAPDGNVCSVAPLRSREWTYLHKEIQTNSERFEIRQDCPSEHQELADTDR